MLFSVKFILDPLIDFLSKFLITPFLTVYFWFVVFLSMFVTNVVCCLAYPFTDQKTFSRIYEIIPAYMIVYSMVLPGFWKLTINDFRKTKTWDKNFVIVANHLSFIDSLLVALAVPLKKKFMIAELFTKIPFFGWLSRASGHVTADLKNPKLNQTAVERAIETIKKDDCSFALFPEGRRELSPYKFETFKTGAYRIALSTELLILPVTLKGSYEAVRIGGLVGFSNIIICIDEPFHVVDEYFPFYIDLTKNIFESNLKLH